MTAQSPSAYFSSATLHAVVVLLLLCAAWVTAQQTREPVKIFEMVAGAGANYNATEAPALGTPDGVELKVPATPESAPRIAEPVPRIAEPEAAPPPPLPVQAAPIQEATPAPPTTPATTPEPSTFISGLAGLCRCLRHEPPIVLEKYASSFACRLEA